MSLPTRRDGPPIGTAVFRPAPTQSPADRERELFYKRAAWKRCRASKLARDPLCEPCKAAGRVVPASQVHHVKDLRERPDLAYDLDNLESACQSCHSSETMKRNHVRWRNADGSPRRSS